MLEDPVVIVGAKRTPMGHFQGQLASVPATRLGASAIKGAVEDAGINLAEINEVLMGCVLPAGLGQAPARQAALGSGLSDSVGCTTVNKVCGSGMRALMFAHDMLLAGTVEAVVAGGMESMSNAPYLLEKARSGYRLGHGKIIDHMFFDGLEDAYDKGCLMGQFADETARDYSLSREEQDNFALESSRKALAAEERGDFRAEIVPVEVKFRKEMRVVDKDELPQEDKLAKISKLKPAFADDGTVTAANASSISDGAAAVVMMRRSTAEKKGVSPKAIIRGHATHSQHPSKFTTAPVGAMRKLSEKLGCPLDSVDLFEINEAFAMVSLAAIKDLNLAHEKVNIYGGACALGHPIGASGCRIVVTLLNALKKTGGKKGIASLCIGGGEATALALELL